MWRCVLYHTSFGQMARDLSTSCSCVRQFFADGCFFLVGNKKMGILKGNKKMGILKDVVKICQNLVFFLFKSISSVSSGNFWGSHILRFGAMLRFLKTRLGSVFFQNIRHRVLLLETVDQDRCVQCSTQSS